MLLDGGEIDDITSMLESGVPADAVAQRLIVPLSSVLAVQQQIRHQATDVASRRSSLALVHRPASEPAMTSPPPHRRG